MTDRERFSLRPKPPAKIILDENFRLIKKSSPEFRLIDMGSPLRNEHSRKSQFISEHSSLAQLANSTLTNLGRARQKYEATMAAIERLERGYREMAERERAFLGSTYSIAILESSFFQRMRDRAQEDYFRNIGVRLEREKKTY